MASVEELLVKALEDLLKDDLKRFQWHLTSQKHMSKSEMENSEVFDTVDKMVARLGPEEAVKITVEILRKMNQNNLAEQLEKQVHGRSGSAVVTSEVVFNSSYPVPSEVLVHTAMNTLLKSRHSLLNEVKVVNVNYQKISETSYAVVILFKLSNISTSEVPELRNNTYTQLQDVANNALNTLLNEPDSPAMKPNSSNFMGSSKQIDGRMEYIFQDGDIIQPVSLLNELRS